MHGVASDAEGLEAEDVDVEKEDRRAHEEYGDGPEDDANQQCLVAISIDLGIERLFDVPCIEVLPIGIPPGPSLNPNLQLL